MDKKNPMIKSEDVDYDLSNHAGKGLIANKFIPSGTFLHVTHIKVRVMQNFGEETQVTPPQWVNVPPNHFYNHSKIKENCCVITELSGEMFLKKLMTTQDINSGEEIFVDYTQDLDLEQPVSGWKE